MENTLYNISQVVGITIIHSLWQGLLIYFALRMALMLAPQLSASKKYLLAVSSLVAITGWFFYTLVNEIAIYNWLAIAPAKFSALPLAFNLPANIRQFNDQTIRYYYSIEEYLPYISMVYVAGLLFNVSRLILGRCKINTIKQTMSIDMVLQRQVNKFADMLNIDHKVKIGISQLVDVPCMVGYFKPLILLPFTLTTLMSSAEIEAILLHELTHIKRNDYLVNLLQQVISTLLFFNPCAQLINRIINEERENSCDDLVVKQAPDPLVYAKALLKLEQTRENNMRMAMAATGKKYQLLNRIERIMKTKKTTQSLRPALAATLILTISIACMAMLNPQIAQGKISVKAIAPMMHNLLADTIKKAKPAHKVVAVKKSAKAKMVVLANNEDKGDEFNDAELDKLSAEVEKHGEAMGKIYESPEFEKLNGELEEKGRAMDEFYNRPELRELQEKQEKLSQDFEKNWGETPEMRETSEKMETIGNKIETYYNSAEFKKINDPLEKKYGIVRNGNYNDRDNENYRNYQAELKKSIPAEISQQTEELKTLGQKMRDRYHSPEYRQAQEAMRAVGDSMRRAFNDPKIKELKAQMRELNEKMRAYRDNPEMKKEKELLRIAQRKLHDYTRSPEFKKRRELRRKDEAFYRWERPERPERPEQPERPERPEKPERPERPEAEPVQPPAAPTAPVPPVPPVNN